MKNLRDYQQLAIDSVADNMAKGNKNLLLCLATGLGKTFLSVKLIEQLGFKSVLWITHREELVNQSALAFIRDKFDDRFSDHVEKMGFINYINDGGIFGGKEFKMGLIKASTFQPYGSVCVASIQTLHKRLSQLDPNQYDAIIIDECHYGTTMLKKAVDYFSPRVRIGLSASPYRKDGVLMSDLFDEIVFNYGIAEGIKNGYLCEMDGVRVKTNISLDNIKTIGGELNQKELAEEVNCPQRNILVKDSYLKYAEGLQALIFCVDIAHCLNLLEVFKSAGINAEAVSSDEERTGDRELTIKKFINRKIDVLINVEILTTGFNYENIGCIIQACPTKSLVKYIQSAGRGTRLKDAEFVAKNGQKCVLIDIVDNTSRHSLINAFNLDKELPPEERVYITSENREKLIEARRVRIEAKHSKDERIQLLPILSPRFKTNIASEPATEPQLKWLRDLNYPVDEVTYTKENCREILGGLPAKKSDIAELKKLGYNTQEPITRNQASYTLWKHNNKLHSRVTK